MKKVFNEAISFTNKNEETLTLVEVIKNKRITSVTIAYLSAKRQEKMKGFKGFIGLKETKQDEKEITINDEKGITLYFTEGIEPATIRFWNKEEFQKLDDGDYDENTLWKRLVMTIVHPYQVNFQIDNLRKINWEERK